MSTGVKITIGLILFFVISIVSIIGFFISAKFTAERHEKGIIYNYKNMQNVHSSVNKIIKTSGLTVKNFGETKIAAIKEGIKRYSDKPQLMMQWIKENPQQIDSKVWEKFQDQMEKQYTKFEREQKLKIARSQAYDQFLSSTIKGTIATMLFNYPTEKTKEIMDKVIQTQDTKEVFETGVDKTVEVF